MGVRVHALAKELNMQSKDLVAYLRTQGHQVKSHMSTIDDTVANILRDRLKPKTAPKKETAASTAGAGASTGGRKGASGGGRAAAAASQSVEPTGAQDRRGGRGDGKGGGDGARSGARRVRYFPTQEPNAASRTARRRPAGGGGRRRTDTAGTGTKGGGGGQRLKTPAIPENLPDKVSVDAPVSLKDLSSALGIKAQALQKKLFQKGQIVTINQYLEDEAVLELGVELGVEIQVRSKEEEREEAVRDIEDFQGEEGDVQSRAPVVTFMGHVDHGKTSLLDKIRETSITTGEEGGITQHLGAYRVDRGNIHVTFIDTPGHKAFTEMRARGANVTDLVVLVVAADDGPKPQTQEAIDHARAAGVPILVALNKMDTPGANPQRCKEALSHLGLMPVEWNGTTEYVEVSAMTGQGIESLLETLSLESEILELNANPKRPAMGVVLEAEATTQRGVVATVLVQQGTLRTGDYVLCGASHGRIRKLVLNGVETVDSAGPAYPVQVIGLNSVPETGDRLYVFENEKQARHLASERERKHRESERAQRQQVTLDNLFDHLQSAEKKELRLIVKADVRGSSEALTRALQQLSTDEVKVSILHSGVGAITQEDIQLAAASQAVVLGFHVVADDRARSLAEENDVDIRHYRVIYQAIEEVKAALESRLSPEIEEEVHGRAEIREVFKASKVGNIAGCFVTDGHLLRSDKVRLIRDGTVVHTGELSSLKRFKDDVKEVREGYECGMKIAGYDDIDVGDIIEGFALVEKQRNL